MKHESKCTAGWSKANRKPPKIRRTQRHASKIACRQKADTSTQDVTKAQTSTFEPTWTKGDDDFFLALRNLLRIWQTVPVSVKVWSGFSLCGFETRSRRDSYRLESPAVSPLCWENRSHTTAIYGRLSMFRKTRFSIQHQISSWAQVSAEERRPNKEFPRWSETITACCFFCVTWPAVPLGSFFSSPRTRCGLQWRNQHGVHVLCGRRELRHQWQEVVEQRWVRLRLRAEINLNDWSGFTTFWSRLKTWQFPCCQDRLVVTIMRTNYQKQHRKYKNSWRRRFIFTANEFADWLLLLLLLGDFESTASRQQFKYGKVFG